MNNRYSIQDPEETFLSETFAIDMDDVAYIKSVRDGADTVWAIFQADGTQIGAAPTRDLAFAAVVQHEMAPMSVH